MLDDILNCECDCNEQGTNYIPFLTKEQINDIKNLKIENETVNTICKVLCILLDEKPQRKANARGEIKNLYLQKVKLLAINGSLTKLLRNLNKIDLNKNQIKRLTTLIDRQENVFNNYIVDNELPLRCERELDIKKIGTISPNISYVLTVI